MQAKIDVVAIKSELLVEANLNEEQIKLIYKKILIINKHKHLISFNKAWQVQLVTGEISYYKEHKNKLDFKALNICHYAILFSSPEVLDMLKQWNEPLLRFTLNTDQTGLFLLYANKDILDWVKANYRAILIKNECFPMAHGAAKNGLVSTMEWIKYNEEPLLKKIDINGESVMHCASASGHKQALAFCNEHDNKWISLLDQNGLSVTHHALNSFNPNQFNFALSLSETPWKFENIHLADSVNCSSNYKMLATLDVALNENISLHSISYKNFIKMDHCNIFNNEIQKKLNNNIQIHKDFNAIKQIFDLVYLGITLDTSSLFCSLKMDLCNYICSMLFNMAIPKQKSHLINHTFFAQVYSDLNSEPKEVNLSLDGGELYFDTIAKISDTATNA
jgi:hypothetical protein